MNIEMDLYLKLGDELRDLFKDLFRPNKKAVIESKMEDVLRAANRIGGKIAEEAKILQNDILLYLKNPKDQKQIEVLKTHAKKIEQETREI